MAEIDGWTGLAERFEADLLEDFAAFVEQIELALQLLQDGARSRLRTALVELDCLADILLYRRAKLVERATDGSSYHNHALTLTVELTRFRGHSSAWVARPGQEGCPHATNPSAVPAGVPPPGG